MSDPVTDLIVAKRNIVTLHEGLKTMQAQRDGDVARITQLETQVAMNAATIAILQGQLALIRVKLMGTGPTG